MEEKIRRESRKLVMDLLKAKDPKCVGAIKVNDIDDVVRDLVPAFDAQVLARLKQEMKKNVKAMERNNETKKLEVYVENEMLDYASAFTIATHFLLDHEKKANRGMSFSGRGLIRLDDMPDFSSTATSLQDRNKSKKV